MDRSSKALLAGLAGVLVLCLAGGTALACEPVSPGPPLQLDGLVPPATLPNAGLSVRTLGLPERCRLLPAVAAGCPISREAALQAADPDADGLQRAAVLAVASSERNPAIGHGHLVWLVFRAPGPPGLAYPMIACPRPPDGSLAPPCRGPRPAQGQLWLIDAVGGSVLAVYAYPTGPIAEPAQRPSKSPPPDVQPTPLKPPGMPLPSPPP